VQAVRSETTRVLVHVIDEADAPVAAVRVGEEVTDEQGRCLLLLPPTDGMRSLKVFHREYAPAYLRVPKLAPGGHAELWVRLLRGVTVEGRVLMEGTDAPAAGAHVRLSFSSAWYPPGAQEHRETRAAADGTVRWDQVPGGQLWISVLAPGFEDSDHSVFLEIVPPREPEPFVLRVARTSHVVLRFLSVEGERIQEGTVSFDMPGGIGVASFDGGTFEEDLRFGTTMRVEVEDQRGRRGTLVVRSDGTPRIERDLVLTAAPATERRSGTVRLLVRSERTGRPLAGATVSYVFEVDNVEYETKTTTDAEGVVTDSDLPPGRMEFTAFARDHKPGRTDVMVAPDRTVDATISLAPALAIRGRVKEGAGATVLLRSGGEERSVHANAEGRFAFEGLDAGTFEIEARTRSGRRSAPLPPIEAGRHDVALTLLPAPPGSAPGAVAMRCTNASGRAITQIAARLECEGGKAKKERLSDPRGIYRITNLEPGRYRVRLWAPKYAEVGALELDIAPGETTKLDVPFGRPLKMLDISVRDVTGRPVGICIVHLFRERDGLPLEAKPSWVSGGTAIWTQSDGRFRLALPTEETVIAILTEAGDYETAPTFARKRVPIPRSGLASVSFRVDRRLKVIACGDAAYRAGFRDGDLIEGWNGWLPRAEGDIPAVLHEPVTATVLRGEERIVLEVPAGYLGLGVDEVLRAP
jgi:hypothetical protein